MSFAASAIHPSRGVGPERVHEVWQIAEKRLAGREWSVGNAYSIADIHLFRLYWRMREPLKLKAEDTPAVYALYERVLARPAVKKTLADEKVAIWIHSELVRWIAEIRDSPRHLARRALDDWLAKLADNLQHNPATQERAELLKRRVLSQDKVIDTSIALWDAFRRALVASLQDPTGLLRERALQELHDIGRQLVEDEALSIRMDGLLADGAAYIVNTYGTELATIISATVNRWDGRETADRIELHVGRDLQFIRINGTVVGGLAGVTIHALSQFL